MTRDTVFTWAPAAILIAGLLLNQTALTQRSLTLDAPLEDALPSTVLGMESESFSMTETEREVAGVDNYLLRNFHHQDGRLINLYIGFYGHQTQGHTIHSPKNCLPGSGWEPLRSATVTLTTADGQDVPINRYVLQNEEDQVLVLYWYQGRGRVAANEYRVKWDLLRDAALRGRTDEALVRIVVPINDSETEAFETAEAMARDVIPEIHAALPK